MMNDLDVCHGHEDPNVSWIVWRMISGSELRLDFRVVFVPSSGVGLGNP